MKHFQALNLSVQGKDMIMSDLAQTIFSFQNQIKLFQRDIDTKSLQHFHLLRGNVNSENDPCTEKIKVYAVSLEDALINFATRFSDLEYLKPTFALLVNPFVVDVEKEKCSA